MNDRYIRADGMETVREAFLRLARADARCMVVERRDENDEVPGIVTNTDIVLRGLARAIGI